MIPSTPPSYAELLQINKELTQHVNNLQKCIWESDIERDRLWKTICKLESQLQHSEHSVRPNPETY